MEQAMGLEFQQIELAGFGTLGLKGLAELDRAR
ncbi:hypothetical protein CPCC7001_2403 [Cyanobium sp. PCC 7001]|nr:hypothetical protein CPCC7001_2403 [Cyanobium sp. PCC 7001]